MGSYRERLKGGEKERRKKRRNGLKTAELAFVIPSTHLCQGTKLVYKNAIGNEFGNEIVMLRKFNAYTGRMEYTELRAPERRRKQFKLDGRNL